MVPQDLHIHTIYSTGDGAVANEQTISLVKSIRHAAITGISDHFEYLVNGRIFDQYEKDVRSAGFKVGIEVSGHSLVPEAVKRNNDYFIYHCSSQEDYDAIELMLGTGKPVIIAHPLIMGTDLDKVPSECYIEVNNRYVWRSNWRAGFSKYVNDRRFVIGSDAHQPNWLNQNVARHVCQVLGIHESILFPEIRTEVLLMSKNSLN